MGEIRAKISDLRDYKRRMKGGTEREGGEWLKGEKRKKVKKGNISIFIK